LGQQAKEQFLKLYDQLAKQAKPLFSSGLVAAD
jgi:hypothetical protein